MSSQPDGTIRMDQSYNFNTETANSFRGRSIDPTSFHAWTRNDMYKSSYAKFHSSVPSSIILELGLTEKYGDSWLHRLCAQHQGLKYTC